MVDTSSQAVIQWPSWWKQATVVCTVFQDTWSQDHTRPDESEKHASRSCQSPPLSVSLHFLPSSSLFLSLCFLCLLLFHSLHFTCTHVYIYRMTPPHSTLTPPTCWRVGWCWYKCWSSCLTWCKTSPPHDRDNKCLTSLMTWWLDSSFTSFLVSLSVCVFSLLPYFTHTHTGESSSNWWTVFREDLELVYSSHSQV